MNLDLEFSHLSQPHFTDQYSRNLATPLKPISHAHAAVWDNSLVVPSLLRAPLMLILFVFVWGINVYVLEQARIPYAQSLLVKPGISMSYSIISSCSF